MSQYKRALELKLIPQKTKAVVKRAFGLDKSEPFSDYQHREVFQVNIDLVEDYTGLNFKWKSVNRLEVEIGEHKLEDISKIGSGEDLKKKRTFKGPNAEILSSPKTKINLIVP